MTMTKEEEEESLQAALADVEILQSAYPDECRVEDEQDGAAADQQQQQQQAAISFPLTVTLRFSPTASCRLQWIAGYPTRTGVQVASYRVSHDRTEQAALDRAVAAIRATSAACCGEQGVEGGLACCAAALQAWEEAVGRMDDNAAEKKNDSITAIAKTSATNGGSDQDPNAAAATNEQSTSPAHSFLHLDLGPTPAGPQIQLSGPPVSHNSVPTR